MINQKRKNKTFANYIYNLIYQVFILVVPLITTPYISRVLMADGIGKYSFTLSISNYFVLFAALGFSVYGQREIARHENDVLERTKTFWEIIIMRSFPTMLAVGLNILLWTLHIYNEYSSLMLVWCLTILATIFDIGFFFQGCEEFGKLTIRNVIVKCLTIASVFIFVKKSDDVWIYVLCLSAGTFLSNISLWVLMPRRLMRVSAANLKPLRHLKPALRLFLPSVATTVYTVLDKTLIGFIVPGTFEETLETGEKIIKSYANVENGYYEQAEKIVKLMLTLLTSLGTVMMPRNAKEAQENDRIALRKNINNACSYTWVLGVPLMFGVAAVAPALVPWFLGPGYSKCILLIQIFSPLILIVGFSNVFGIQYLIPTGQDKKYTIAIVSGAIANLCLNCFMIYFWWSAGAIIASLGAELLITVLMGFMIRKEIDIKTILKAAIKPLIAGTIMFFSVYFTCINIEASILNTILLVLEGIGIYGLLIIVLKDRAVLLGFEHIKAWRKTRRSSSKNEKDE